MYVSEITVQVRCMESDVYPYKDINMPQKNSSYSYNLHPIFKSDKGSLLFFFFF